eukprot:TRINITY_DN72083_c0_g1_i1.p1 TRINITY_DN72083_c0_g1~~TRINITY_DN72083_c0_g1_i1.p1  ORF type:complete len:116 (+),score=12.23 TRINITY_DN72083_c0_g1_i1:56-403(+)
MRCRREQGASSHSVTTANLGCIVSATSADAGATGDTTGTAETFAASVLEAVCTSEPRPILGWSLVFGSVLLWITLVYTMFATNDAYFCHLLPMLVPSLCFFRYWGWLSLEMFKNA